MDKLDLIQKVHQKHVDKLLEIPGVHRVGIAYKIVDGKETDELCISVSVDEKLPVNNIDKKHLIPAVLGIEGIKTDVKQSSRPCSHGGKEQAGFINVPKKLIKGGSMIAVKDQLYIENEALGTLGAFFYDLKAKEIYGFTTVLNKFSYYFLEFENPIKWF